MSRYLTLPAAPMFAGKAAANRNRALNFIRLSVATAEGVGPN